MFPLTPSLTDWLTTPAAQEALAELAAADLGEQASLALLPRLRRTWSTEQAAALLDQARLRRKAAVKFAHPERLLFTDAALQQASSAAVAAYHAALFVAHGASRVADLGCGIGADTLALASAGLSVLAVEMDPVRARLAAFNVAAAGLAEQVTVQQADWRTLTLAADAGFVDPSRRAGSQRLFRLADMEPPLTDVLALQARLPRLAVKTLPGIADEEIPAAAEVEFVSERGEMKEALLRLGALRTGAARRATLLPGRQHLVADAAAWVGSGPPRAFLYEPDAAVIRATLVQTLAAQLHATQLDPTIAYLTADEAMETPWARRWSVLRHGPFHLKTLNQWLRELAAGEVVVKKRGSAVDPDEFRRRLQTTAGGRSFTVFLTRVDGKPWMVVGESYASAGLTASRMRHR